MEIVKAGGDDTIQQLTRLFNLAYRTEVDPLDWQRGLISPIRKKGDVTVCDNHWGITLLAHTGKVYTKILETLSPRGDLSLPFWEWRPPLAAPHALPISAYSILLCRLSTAHLSAPLTPHNAYASTPLLPSLGCISV